MKSITQIIESIKKAVDNSLENEVNENVVLDQVDLDKVFTNDDGESIEFDWEEYHSLLDNAGLEYQIGENGDMIKSVKTGS